VEVFDERIVSEYGGGDVFIAPDERTIIFSSSQAGGYGNTDLYVSFRRGDGAWTAPQNLGSTINSAYQEYCPSLSPDGKYFFFSSYKRPEQTSVPEMRSLDEILRLYRQPYNGAGDVYWVDAAVLQTLREIAPVEQARRTLRSNDDLATRRLEPQLHKKVVSGQLTRLRALEIPTRAADSVIHDRTSLLEWVYLRSPRFPSRQPWGGLIPAWNRQTAVN
jgi:hypothetical protein